MPSTSGNKYDGSVRGGTLTTQVFINDGCKFFLYESLMNSIKAKRVSKKNANDERLPMRTKKGHTSLDTVFNKTPPHKLQLLTKKVSSDMKLEGVWEGQLIIEVGKEFHNGITLIKKDD